MMIMMMIIITIVITYYFKKKKEKEENRRITRRGGRRKELIWGIASHILYSRLMKIKKKAEKKDNIPQAENGLTYNTNSENLSVQNS